MKLPTEFEERMRTLLRADYSDFEAAMDTAPVRALRVNTLKYSVNDIEGDLGKALEPLSFCPEGFIFDLEHIGSHPLHHSGAVYVQEPAAMAAVECTDILPGMRILDVCASPGGKSTQAAAKLRGEGLIVSNEIDPKRSKVLAQNIERMGVRNAVVTNTDSAELGKVYRGEFDLVIVDAPCSGEGMMRKNPLAVSEWSISNVKMCAERQREILENIAGTVKRGGRLLYSTCTFSPEENEMRIADFLRSHPDFRLVPVNERVRKVTADGLTEYGEEMRLCRRFYPHVSRGEGQFIALLERDAEAEDGKPFEEGKKKKGESKRPDKSSAAEEAAVKAFLSEVLTSEGIAEAEKYAVTNDGEGNYYLSVKIQMPKSVRSRGVLVGTVQKGRVVPHHSFFMAYGGHFKRQIRLTADDPRVKKYLHGESIEVDEPNGFAAVLVCGAAVGGAKITLGEAKNYYPKGLRS